jgi:hypothetical protein
MSKIHYFQRFDGKENWMTNATLLLLSRLYHYNMGKFQAVLKDILDENNLDLNIAVQFEQQKRGKSSVVDGVISLASFKIVIETKLNDNFTTDQLKRHFDELTGDYQQKILLCLSKNKIGEPMRREMVEATNQEQYKDIQIASTTYEDISQIIGDNLSDFDLEMREILADYISLCEENGLTNLDKSTMLAFTAGESLNENLEYRIYYDAATRNHNLKFKYIGLYNSKAIVAVGILQKIIHCDYHNGQLISTSVDSLSDLTEDEQNRIKNTIINTEYYDLRKGKKFFLVDNFFPTNFVKTSFSSLRSKKYFWLNEIPGFTTGISAEQVAGLLNGKTWE